MNQEPQKDVMSMTLQQRQHRELLNRVSMLKRDID